jgi:hypothetical protein
MKRKLISNDDVSPGQDSLTEVEVDVKVNC